MAAKPLPSQQELLKTFRYDQEAGVLYWKFRSPDTKGDKIFNSRWGGRPAGRFICGYLCSRVNGATYRNARIIWKMSFGYDPNIIDHSDGNRTNNRLSNLKDCDLTANARNQGLSGRNASGRIGVHWNTARKKWVASISIADSCIPLGRFDDIDEAIAAREEAEIKHGFHPMHGKRLAV